MQLIMSRDKKQWMEFLRTENDYMTFLLEAFEVPETIENESDEEYLLDVPHKKPRLMNSENEPALTAEELEEKANKMKRKVEIRENLKKKKTKPKTSTKAERKKAKEEKFLKLQKMQNLKNVMANETMKKNPKEKKIKPDPDQETNGTAEKVFNKEGKIIFSKVQIEGEKKKIKKGHNTNPQANLLKLKSQKKKIKELIESGDKAKAKVEKQKMLWETAFDKTEGIKVKDNEEILKKTIKKRKVLKKKSKEKWNERKKKVEEKEFSKQKKREDNLNKRKTDNKKTKLKRAINKGRVF
ncbi:surfeit locus protein 6 homolog [Chironomus tepperi]|uniref:surfeit locus protein 6 homolog n=1 Tax=Chironomus tepperi TaxID=113505 RepID=UPI00391F8E62